MGILGMDMEAQLVPQEPGDREPDRQRIREKNEEKEKKLRSYHK